MSNARIKFGRLYDRWKWLMDCPFEDGQPFLETAWNAGMEEDQREAYEALRALENPEINRLLDELGTGNTSEDEVYSAIENLLEEAK